jgi:putative ABC transport system permease protein
VLGSVLAEAAVVGIIASGFGVVLGLGTATMIRGLMAAVGVDLPDHPLVLTGGTVAASMLTGVAVTFGSALLPAWKAARVSPLAAMRDVAVDSSARSKVRAAIGITILAAGAFALLFGLYVAESYEGAIVGAGAGATFLGVVVLGPVIAAPFCRQLGRAALRGGVVKDLAVQNAARNPRRTAGTAAALMIGVGLVSLITVFAESVRTTIDYEVRDRFQGDLVIDSGSFGFGGLPPALADELATLEEVEAAAAMRFALVEVNGTGELALGIDPEELSAISPQHTAEGDLGQLRPGQIAVSGGAMRFWGWAVGDEVELTFAETGPQRFTIAAVTTESPIAGGEDGSFDYTLHNDDIDANVPQPFDVLVYVRLAAEARGEAGVTAVEAVAAKYPNADVLDLDAYAKRQSDQINQFLGLIFGLLALAVIVALIGIANTLSLSIVERTREIGLLRAVGMTRTQLRRAVRGEAVLIALLGTLLGLGVGVFLGVSLVLSLEDDGLHLTVPPGQLVTIAVLGALAGVLSSVVPARRVARLDVLASIASE